MLIKDKVKYLFLKNKLRYPGPFHPMETAVVRSVVQNVVKDKEISFKNTINIGKITKEELCYQAFLNFFV